MTKEMPSTEGAGRFQTRYYLQQPLPQHSLGLHSHRCMLTGQKYHLESGLIAVVPVSLLDNPNTSQLKKHGRVVVCDCA